MNQKELIGFRRRVRVLGYFLKHEPERVLKTIQLAINIFLYILVTFLSVRIVFKLYSIDKSWALTNLIDRLTDIFVNPFFRLFPNISIIGSSYFETAAFVSLISIIVTLGLYNGLMYLLLPLFRNISRYKQLSIIRESSGISIRLTA